jgi:hypothetical protein
MMQSNSTENNENNRSRIFRRLRRLLRKLIWTNNHIHHSRKPVSQPIGSSKPDPVKRRRRKKSFWNNMFGNNMNWQNRLTGNVEKKESERAEEFNTTNKLQIPADNPLKNSPVVHRHRKRRKKGIFIRLIGKRVNEVQTQKLSDSIRTPGQSNSQPIHHHRKRKKNFLKQIFSKKEKKPAKLNLPGNKPQVPVEKEKVIYSDYVPYFINSTMMFLLSYLVAWLTYQMSVIVTSSLFHIDSVLFFFEVMFPVGNSSDLWSSFNIILITISGPLVSLGAGSLYFVFLIRKNKLKGNRLMFFNWLVIHSYCMFFAAFVAGVITHQGFGYVANWLYMNVFFKILVSLIFLFSLSWISFKNARHILETSNSVFRIKPKNRVIFLLGQTILPWLVGTMLLVAIKYPGFTPQHENILVYDVIIIVSVLFMIIPPFFNKQAHPRLSVEKERKQTSISKRNIMITVLALLLFRIGLAGGIHFIIQFAVNISRYM